MRRSVKTGELTLGHTDKVPINKRLFPSNWERSAARASGVVRLFVDQGISKSRLVAIRHAANLPIATNDAPEGAGVQSNGFR